MNDLNQFKTAAINYFRKGGWSGRCRELKELNKASDWETLYYAIFAFADAIGDRKGYGDEGKGSLHSEFIEAIEKESAIKFNHDAL